MKDTILNLFVITAAFGAIVVSALGNADSAELMSVANTPHVAEMQKTIVAAKRLPAGQLPG